MSVVASTSRRLLQASPWSRFGARSLATAPSAPAPTPPLDSSSTPSSAPSPTLSPLPGSVVLPEAFRAQTPDLSTSPASVRRTSAPSTTTTFAGRRHTQRLTQPYKLHVFSTRNNTILTLTTSPSGGADPSPSDPHHPIAWVSAGSAGYKGAARGTYDAAVEVALKMFQKVGDLLDPPVLSGGQKKKAAGPKPTELEVIWKGFGQGRDAVFRTLMGAEGDKVRGLVRRVTDATPLKIGGTRAKKRRVV
ncbi:SPOSA6832_01261, partial [Sporobolomyces salmonicolor]